MSLHAAAKRGDLSVLRKLLAKGADVDEVDACAERALGRRASAARRRGRREQGGFSWLLYTPLCVAAMNGHVTLVDALLRAGADKDAARDDGATPLYTAAQNGHGNVVDALLRAGVDKDKRHCTGASPLFVAAQGGKCDVVEMLLRAGVAAD